ncbi:PAC2 family protein [Chloroflexota bacterium]
MNGREYLVFSERPELKNPKLVCGITGWVDGGEASTGSVEYLIKKLKVKKFAELPVDRFHVYQLPGQVSLRPNIKIEDGILKYHRFPQNRFYYWINPEAGDDLILFLGTEPCLNWEEYGGAIISLAEEFGVVRIYQLGGVMDETPHTREPNVSCTCSSESLKEEMQGYGVQFGSYEGPGSFATAMLHLCRNKSIEVVDIMARATYYPEFNVVIAHNPKTIRAVVRRLNSLLHLNLDISDLDKQAEELEAKLGFMVSQSPEFRAYVNELEKDYIEAKYDEPLDVSADEAIHLAEEFLREKREE